MPRQQRVKTNYPGVYHIEGREIGTGKPERIYYLYYRKDGKKIEEKAGRQFKDDMTPARAARIRSLRISRKEPSNTEQREIRKKQNEALQNRWTISRLWEEYKKVNSIKGIATDENRYQNYLEDPFGKKEPHELVSLDIDRLQVKLLKTKKPATVKNTLELLRRIINFGVKRSLCDSVKFTIRMPTVNNQKTENLTQDQLTALLDVLEKDDNKLAAGFMKMVLFTGMRRGELFNLQWKDIDFRRGFIHIRDPKSGSDQIIPLNSEARQVLKNTPKTKSPYIFPGRDGRKRTDIKKSVNRLKTDAGIPEDFRALHGLRHVYASMLASSGKVDLYTLQKLLTHKSSAMTQRYAHLRDEVLKQASDLAGDIIKQAAKNKEDNVIETGK